MRIHPAKWFRRARPRPRRFFAWLPRRMSNGTVVWLEWVERYPLYRGERR